MEQSPWQYPSPPNPPVQWTPAPPPPGSPYPFGAPGASGPVPPTGPRRNRAQWWRGALAGAVAGAVAAAGVGVVWKTDTTTTPAVSAASAAASGTKNVVTISSTETGVHAVLAKAQASVVSIEVQTTSKRGPYTVQGAAAGTGVIITADGEVLTNAHVVAGATSVSVKMSDGTTYPATIIGSDTTNDLALLKITGASNLTAATLGSSAAAQVGDEVVAIGNALDLEGTPTVTVGIISAKDRSLDDGQGTTMSGLLQTDAAINSGNSGGPLLNMNGEVVGINTAMIQNSQNLGFAISIDTAKTVIDHLRGGS
jgi:S1-C subfamily serine protease